MAAWILLEGFRLDGWHTVVEGVGAGCRVILLCNAMSADGCMGCAVRLGTQSGSSAMMALEETGC